MSQTVEVCKSGIQIDFLTKYVFTEFTGPELESEWLGEFICKVYLFQHYLPRKPHDSPSKYVLLENDILECC